MIQRHLSQQTVQNLKVHALFERDSIVTFSMDPFPQVTFLLAEAGSQDVFAGQRQAGRSKTVPHWNAVDLGHQGSGALEIRVR